MRNLIQFLWKHHFTLLFLLLEVIAFSLLFHNNKFHKAGFLNTTNAVSGNLYNMVSNVTEYFELKGRNEELARENAKLQTLNKNAFVILKGRLVAINDTLYKQQYKYLGAKVVNSSVNKRNNYLILNRGSEQGVEPEMGVICADGIVGVVRDVSRNYCAVISMLHKNSKVSAKLKRNDYFGILEWDGMDPKYVKLSDIPRHVVLHKGDTVITRGSSTVFPAGVMVGTISDFNQVPGSNFYDITVKLTTNFNKLAHVYIIRNLMKQEQVELEIKIEEQ